ncbi:hypothetical protein [Streptomyces roseochromogenus]|uniref:Uncharacterized protein n=1 Tax=Streptomyces roseochromogenus subsp. oscitans DS 12.976 TaxID=1352936 RepID=V6KUM1_STRRC|nr:hypothetical protein [Streptomyces roseochromogenus]EST35688.1 hypothetical protein M878_04760 [Streptomyces roseochromogenus subsp. oscitans DS 12.976]
MPQESVAGRAGRRTPVLAILVGLTLMLVAHVVSCALHHLDGAPHIAARTVSMTSEAQGAGALAVVSGSAGRPAGHDVDGHHDHDSTCCDPADRPADLRASTAALVLALLVLVLARRGLLSPSVPDTLGRAGPERSPACAGVHLLRCVCVSRT